MKNFLIIIPLIVLLFENLDAQYFSDDGFYNGTSKGNAYNIIRSMCLQNLEIKENTIIGNRNYDGTWLFYEFHFCQNKLIFYRKSLIPSVKNLIFIINDLSLKYGKDFKTYTNISMEVFGEERSLIFLWEKTVYRVEISYSVYPTNESLAVRYSVPNKCVND